MSQHMFWMKVTLLLTYYFLPNTKQYVKCGDIESCLLDAVCGVPQVSVLGTLLIILYINDMDIK